MKITRQDLIYMCIHAYIRFFFCTRKQIYRRQVFSKSGNSVQGVAQMLSLYLLSGNTWKALPSHCCVSSLFYSLSKVKCASIFANFKRKCPLMTWYLDFSFLLSFISCCSASKWTHWWGPGAAGVFRGLCAESYKNQTVCLSLASWFKGISVIGVRESRVHPAIITQKLSETSLGRTLNWMNEVV